MNRKTAVIVEDEYPARLRMQEMLAVYDLQIEILGTADTGKKAIAMIEKQKPDVVFLDIQLPDMTGFEMLEKITYEPWIIFTTAYSSFALQAFENNAVDYLVKPIETDRLAQAINKLMNWGDKVDWHMLKELMRGIPKPKPIHNLAIKKKDKILLVDFEDISFLQAEDKYTNVYMKSGEQHLLSKSLNQLMDLLPAQFIRVHRSFIINRTIVIEIQKYFKGKFILHLSDSKNSKITTGETYTHLIKSAFNL